MTNFFSQKEPNTIAVLYALILKLKVKVSKLTLENALLNHPDYPSLLAVSDCLTGWAIPNVSYKINKIGYDLDKLPVPFIAHLKGKEYVLVEDRSNGQLLCSNEKKRRKKISYEEFLNSWDGVFLYSEASEKSGEKDYFNNSIKSWLYQNRTLLLFLVFLLGIVVLTRKEEMTWDLSILFFLKMMGVVVSTLLLAHSINANNSLVQNLCGLGKKNDCNAILKSDAARITSWLSWSEVGMFYFAGSLISLLIDYSSVTLLAWFNLLCLPYTFYSIGYQLIKKNWCILCCTIQGILWLEFATFLAFFSFSFPVFTYSDAILILLSFLTPAIFWLFLKPLLIKAEETKTLKQQLKKFKYNSQLFQQILTSQPKYEVTDDLMPIVLGSPNAETTITMISNPFCGPCGKAHAQLEEWLATRDDLKLKIIFATADHDDDQRTKVARHLTALSFNNAVNLEKALNDWYNHKNKNYNDWAQTYPVEIDSSISKITEKHKAWCMQAEISSTPTILVNGYKLADPYRLEDIQYLLA